MLTLKPRKQQLWAGAGKTNLKAHNSREWAWGEAAGWQVVRETGQGSGEAEEGGGQGVLGPGSHTVSGG